MKRSEMIEIIGEALSRKWFSTNLDKRGNRVEVWKIEAEGILDAIEKAGMAPPERYRSHDWHERGITYAEWTQKPSKVREWEDEL